LVDLFVELSRAGISPFLVVEIPEVQEGDWWPIATGDVPYEGVSPLVLGLAPEMEAKFLCTKTAVQRRDVDGGCLFLGYRTKRIPDLGSFF
jgi:hypothetical protein